MKGRLEYRTMQSLRSAPEPLQITIQGKLPRQPYVRRTDITHILFRGINAPGPVFYKFSFSEKFSDLALPFGAVKTCI